MEQITTESIITALQEQVLRAVQTHIPLAPERFINAGIELVAFLGNENDKMAELYQKAHTIAYEAIKEGKTAAEGELKMKSSAEYKEMLKQKGKVEQIMEVVRLCKIRSQLSNQEFPLSEV